MATLLEKHLKLEEMKKIRNWRNEGYELEKIKELVDKTNITDEEIEHVVNKRSRKEDLKNIIGALLADPLLVNEIVNPSYKIVAPCVVIIAKYRFDHNNEINNLEE